MVFQTIISISRWEHSWEWSQVKRPFCIYTATIFGLYPEMFDTLHDLLCAFDSLSSLPFFDGMWLKGAVLAICLVLFRGTGLRLPSLWHPMEVQG